MFHSSEQYIQYAKPMLFNDKDASAKKNLQVTLLLNVVKKIMNFDKMQNKSVSEEYMISSGKIPK